MRAYPLVEAGDPEASDGYLAEEDAQRPLGSCLRDEPGRRGILRIGKIKLSMDRMSLD
jgi:hypothetical protein